MFSWAHAAGALVSPGAEQGIDQDVQVLADVIPGLDDVPAMAIDPGRQVRLDRLPLLDDQGAMLEVAQP